MADENRTAVVTGASSGIGEATARALAAAGFEVVAAARRLERCEELAEQIGGRALRLDVTDTDSVAELAEAVPDAAVLVNNAGGALGLEPIAEADEQKWRAMYESNVMGVMRVTRALLPAMVKSGNGHVVVVGSVAGLPQIALAAGAKLAIVTQGPTPYDGDAEIKLDGDVVEEMSAMLASLDRSPA